MHDHGVIDIPYLYFFKTVVIKRLNKIISPSLFRTQWSCKSFEPLNSFSVINRLIFTQLRRVASFAKLSITILNSL
jgi:hypothetical protein